jgi:hypothetical protein
MSRFKPGDLVRIIPPPPSIKYDNTLVFVDYTLMGKLGTVAKEYYDPMVYTLYRFTYYQVNVFGIDAIAAEFCLELVPGMPDELSDIDAEELAHGAIE